MTYERILKSTNGNPIVAHVLKSHDYDYHFSITRNMTLDYIKKQLQRDTWDTAVNFHYFNILSPDYVAKTKKELVQMVYKKVLEITGSKETAMNTPIFLFDQDKGRWQMAVPKWSGPRFYDRTYLSGLTNLDYGHFRTIDWRWGQCFISKLARAKDVRRLIKNIQKYQESAQVIQFDDRNEQLIYICKDLLEDLQYHKDGFVGQDHMLYWDCDDRCWM